MDESQFIPHLRGGGTSCYWRLKFKDIDFDNRIISVQRTIIRSEEGYKVREGCKTEKSKRKLQIPEYILNLIQAIPHETDDEFIIDVNPHSLYLRFKRIVKKSNIDMTFHDLRKLNASIMLMLGIPDKYAMERGGWSSNTILKSVYQKTFSSERQKVDKIIDSYFYDAIGNSSNENHTKSHK